MTVSVIKKKLVLQAIQVLRDLHKIYYEDSSKKKPLLEDDENSTLFLQVMLKKIPKRKLIEMIKMNLPHPLVKDSHEICLITGDLDKKNHKAEIEPDVLHYKTLLDSHGITCISEVLTLRQLRTEYKPFEAKQKLLAAYDLFLADGKIGECLPKVLGRHFFKKRKFPIQINLKTSNLKEQIQKALSTKVFYVTGQGNSCNSEVAYLDMADSEILANVNAMAEALSKKIPGTWDNVMGIYLKTAKSKAIPLYISYDSPNAVQLQDEKDEKDFQIDELTTLPNVCVKVYTDGRVETVRMKEVYTDGRVETVSLKEIKEEEIDETTENVIETDNLDSNFQELCEGEDMQKFETKYSKQQVKLEKEVRTEKQKKKNINKKPVFSDVSSDKDVEATDIDSRKKSKRTSEENISNIVENNADTICEKIKKRGEEIVENTPHTVSLEDEKKKSKGKKKKSKSGVENSLATSVEISDDGIIDKKTKSKGRTEKMVSNAYDDNLFILRRERKRDKSKNAIENTLTISAKISGISVTDAKGKRKESKEEREKIVHDASDTNSFNVQGKKKKGKRKNAIENTITIAAETDIEDKRKKSKRKTEKIVADTFDNLVTKGKIKKGKNENIVENTISAETAIENTRKKSKRKTEKIVAGTFDNLVTIKGKIKKGKNKNSVEKTISAESEFAEGNKKSAFKRKRVESESVILDPTESVENSESPMQTTKKRKIEGLNMKRYQNMKESRKSNRKKKQQRAK